MVGASLLQSDDDSDVPDLNLGGVASRRRKFFNRPLTDDYEEIRSRRKTYKNIMFMSFFLIFLILLYFVYNAISRINKINEELKELRLSNQQIEEMSEEIKRLKFQFNLIQENSISSNVTAKPTTELIYNQLTSISSRLDVLKDGFQKTSSSMEDVTSRMSQVENKCLSVCQHDTVGGMPVPRVREQPRRRQAASKKATNTVEDIVFRRNE